MAKRPKKKKPSKTITTKGGKTFIDIDCGLSDSFVSSVQIQFTTLSEMILVIKILPKSPHIESPCYVSRKSSTTDMSSNSAQSFTLSGILDNF